MGSTLSFLLISLLLSSLLSPFSHAARHHRSQPRISRYTNLPKLRADMMIRSLNLFPNHNISMPIKEESSVASPRIVEKPINFNALGSSGPSVNEFGHFAGYYKLPNTKAARMFYYFFESRNGKDDPVVIWLTGGPGCSGQLALFYENGPVKIKNDSMSLVWNDYGWDLASNIIYVDQPTGTGFSYTTDDSDYRYDEDGVSNDLYNFLQEFFKAHPDYVQHDFYITGESYSGHYIPALASRVDKGNKNKEGIHINLKGFAMGNGLTDPAIQYKAYTDFSLANKLIGKSDYDRINQLVPGCEQAIEACGTDGGDACENAYNACNSIFYEILDVAGNINYYDIRKTCQGQLCYDFSAMETFLNNETVKEALGVGNIEFVSCSTDVYFDMLDDWMKDLELGIPALLEEGIRVLIYAGEKDLICNWLGNSRWVSAMKWSGQEAFNAAPTVPYEVDGQKAGEMKSHGVLTFLKVYEAGHMVPMDQPNAALQMLKSWTQGKLGFA